MSKFREYHNYMNQCCAERMEEIRRRGAESASYDWGAAGRRAHFIALGRTNELREVLGFAPVLDTAEGRRRVSEHNIICEVSRSGLSIDGVRERIEAVGLSQVLREFAEPSRGAPANSPLGCFSFEATPR